MAERQYIGARYVPIFATPIEWNDQTTYEPLTIVTYLGASYTSRKTVTPGILPTNQEYWALTGNYNAQVEEYRQQVVKLEGVVSGNTQNIASLQTTTARIDNQLNGKFLFIGDSYALPEYGDWVAKTAKMLGLVEGQTYWNLATTSSNISSGVWLGNLTGWVNEHQNEVNNIKMIIAGGGINDSDSESYAKLPQALMNLGAYVKNTFPSTTRCALVYFGWALNSSPILAGRTAPWRSACQGLWTRATAFGQLEYLTGCESVLHNRTLIGPDGLHPNAEGGSRIAECISNVVLSGNAMVNYSTSDAVITPVAGTVNGQLSQTLFDNQAVISFIGLTITDLNLHVSGGNFSKVATVALPYGNSLNVFDCPTIINYTTAQKLLNCKYRIYNDELQIAVFDIDPSTNSFYDITIANIAGINAALPVNPITD